MADAVLRQIIERHSDEILSEWVAEQTSATGLRAGLLRASELREQCQGFLRRLTVALTQAGAGGVESPAFDDVRSFLTELSRSRGEQGFTPSETAMFVFSIKSPLFTRIRAALIERPEDLAEELWNATALLDRLGLYTTEVYQRSRDEIIVRQQEEMLELSTPVVKLWDGILALPLIGTLDSNRTQIVMEALLERVVATGSQIAIIDITGVPTVDTLVAQHLMKTVAAARLMGVDCIISGIRPQIAQTIVHLGVQLGDVATKATLADAFKYAIRKMGNGRGLLEA